MIYVVDDETMLLDLARHILEGEGYEVMTYRDPSEALLALRRLGRKPTLILSDYHMKTMNGLELIAACRRISPTLKVALVSGTVESAMLEDVEDRPDAFLAKPYGHRALIRLVHTLLD